MRIQSLSMRVAVAALAWILIAQALPLGCFSAVSAAEQANGLKGQYFNSDTQECLLTRTDRTIDFNWDEKSPDPKVSRTHFNVRWTGELLPRYTETYTIIADVDDGVRLWVDGRLLIDAYDYQVGERNARIALTAGKKVRIKLHYKQIDQKAHARLYWSSRSQPREIIPTSQLSTAADVPVRIDGIDVFPALGVVNQHVDLRATSSEGAGTVRYTWSKMNGPGVVSWEKKNGTPLGGFGTAFFDKEGDYTLRLTVADANGSTTKDVSVKIGPAIVPGGVVDESAFEPGGKGIIFYVDNQNPDARDNRAGTEPKQPLKSIATAVSKAMAQSEKGIPSKVSIRPGTYREGFVVQGSGGTLVFEGAAPGKVLISGATADGWELASWTPVAGAPGLYKKPWKHKYPLVEPQGSTNARKYPNIHLFRRELVVVNGVGLKPFQLEDIAWTIDPRPTFTYKRYLDPVKSLQPGTFAINDQKTEGHPDCDMVFMRLPEGVDPKTAKIEVADDRINVTEPPEPCGHQPRRCRSAQSELRLQRHDLQQRHGAVQHGGGRRPRGTFPRECRD